MKSLVPFCFISLLSLNTARAEVHVWEKVELTFHAQNQYANPYTNVEVWVDLKGPGFDKRCYGFWDGGDVFRVRVLATQPGQWTWRSGSNQKDAGLNNQHGGFTAVAWSEAEKESVPTRRGLIESTPTAMPCSTPTARRILLLGDTWYAAATFRFKWYDDDKERPIGPDAGFKDYVRLRKSQGFNSVAIIAAFPNWANDAAAVGYLVDKKREPRRALGVGESRRHRQSRPARPMAREGHDQRRRPGVSVPRQGARLRAGLSRTWTASTRNISNIWTGRSIT